MFVYTHITTGIVWVSRAGRVLEHTGVSRAWVTWPLINWSMLTVLSLECHYLHYSQCECEPSSLFHHPVSTMLIAFLWASSCHQCMLSIVSLLTHWPPWRGTSCAVSAIECSLSYSTPHWCQPLITCIILFPGVCWLLCANISSVHSSFPCF